MESFEIAVVVIGLGTAGKVVRGDRRGAGRHGVLICSAFFLRAPLERCPSNRPVFRGYSAYELRYYWVGEGLGFGWPGGILSLIWLTLLGDSYWPARRLPAYEA